jgi:hypothetical protein
MTEIELAPKHTQISPAPKHIEICPGPKDIEIRPALNAEFLFYLFLDAKTCDALVGDLEERFKLIYERLGKRRANLWYWTQVISSVSPIVWATMKKLSGLTALLELYRKIRQ